MTKEEEAQLDALSGCTDRATKLFPALGADDTAIDSKAGEVTEQNWRVGTDGHFVLEVPNIAPDRTSQFLFTCAGNIRRRNIELLEFDGMAKRPAAGEIWSY